MYADTLWAGWLRNWIAVTAATVLLLAAAGVWVALDEQSYVGRAQVLVSVKVPDSGQDPTYQVEISRTLTINYVMDDLEQLVTGAAFAGLQGSLTATAPTIAADTAAATSVRPVRDLLRVVVLLVMRLPSCVQCRNRGLRFDVRAG